MQIYSVKADKELGVTEFAGLHFSHCIDCKYTLCSCFLPLLSVCIYIYIYIYIYIFFFFFLQLAFRQSQENYCINI